MIDGQTQIDERLLAQLSPETAAALQGIDSYELRGDAADLLSALKVIIEVGSSTHEGTVDDSRPHASLLEQVQRRTGIEVAANIGSQAVSASENEPVTPEEASAEELDSTAIRERLIESLGIVVHRKTPANMKNFLSDVFPASHNDRVFELNPYRSAVLSEVILRVYLEAKHHTVRKRGRDRNAEYTRRNIGLSGEPMDAAQIATAKVVDYQEVHRRILKTCNDVGLCVSKDEMTTLLELVEEDKYVEIFRYVSKVGTEEYASVSHQAEPATTEAAPTEEPESTPESEVSTENQADINNEEIEKAELNDDTDQYQIIDSASQEHTVAINPETLEVTIDGQSHELPNNNTSRNIVKIIQVLIENPEAKFQSAKLHELGVAANTGSKAARTQAITLALRRAQELTVSTQSGDLPLVFKPSARMYSLNPELKPSVVEASKTEDRSANRPEEVDPTLDYEIDYSNVHLASEQITISGEQYPLFRAHHEFLAAVIEYGRPIHILELTKAVSTQEAIDKDDIEETEETMFELVKRGLVIEHRNIGANIRYEVNQDAKSYREEAYEIDIDEQPLHLNAFDREVLEVLLSIREPSSIQEIAEIMSGGDGLQREEYNQLALTIKKYFYPHMIVNRERMPGRKTRGFIISGKHKDRLASLLNRR